MNNAREFHPSLNTHGLDRRQVIKILAGSLLSAAAFLHLKEIDDNTDGTLAGAVRSLGNHVEVAPASTRSDNIELYNTYHHDLGLTEKQWVDGGVAEGIDIGTRIYWDTPLKESLPLLIGHLKSADIDPGIAIPVIGYWGTEKIGSNLGDIRETGEQIFQTVAAHEVTQADSLLSRVLHREKPLKQVISAENQLLNSMPYGSPIYRKKNFYDSNSYHGFF